MGIDKHMCRGKRIDNGAWVCGYYLCLGGRYHYILTGKADITRGFPALEKYQVDPTSVGRFTGRIDRTGKPMFESDFVRYMTPHGFEIDAEVRIGKYTQYGSSEKSEPMQCCGLYFRMIGYTRPDWAEPDGFDPGNRYNEISPLELYDAEQTKPTIIGNKTDDPELLMCNGKNAVSSCLHGYGCRCNEIGEEIVFCELTGRYMNITLGECLGNCESQKRDNGFQLSINRESVEIHE